MLDEISADFPAVGLFGHLSSILPAAAKCPVAMVSIALLATSIHQ
jgi:hypothetical protein